MQVSGYCDTCSLAHTTAADGINQGPCPVPLLRFRTTLFPADGADVFDAYGFPGESSGLVR